MHQSFRLSKLKSRIEEHLMQRLRSTALSQPYQSPSTSHIHALLIAVSDPLRTCGMQARRRVQQLEEKLLELELQDESEVRHQGLHIYTLGWRRYSNSLYNYAHLSSSKGFFSREI